MNTKADNSTPSPAGSQNCSVCRDLLTHMSQFFEMLDGIRKGSADQWLTVEEVAEELKISKSIVYRVIRNGELEAVNIVNNNGKIVQKGHYRVKRQSLEDYIQSKTVHPIPKPSKTFTHTRHLPKVRNHLGL
jgi:excisionase family DNA binding protein